MNFDLKTLIGKLNPVCRKGLETAASLCVSQTNYSIEIEHYLSKLIEVEDTDLSRLFRYYKVSTGELSRQLMASIEKFKRGNNRTPAFSEQVLQMIQEAWLLVSLRFGEQQVRSGALLLALFEQDSLRGIVIESLPALVKISRESLRAELMAIARGSCEDLIQAPVTAGDSGHRGSQPSGGIRTTPALDQYTIDLTERARLGQIDPVHGRDFEIRQVIDILTRRRQNNPILTGEAGVGKTAVAEGFAQRIISGDVPPPLKSVSLRALDLALLQAGAGIKGEFEERLKNVINEVKHSPSPIILFIDEAHTLIGAGGTAGQGDAANMIKPALARGELRTIAATTWSEYKKYFEKDKALARRFQVVQVEEPDEKTAAEMLRATVAFLEKHHRVLILDEAVKDAVKLSHRHITGRQLPDKAVSVLDTACARVAVAQSGTPPPVEDCRRRIELLNLEASILKREQAAGQDHGERIARLSHDLQKAEDLLQKLETHWRRELDEAKRAQEIQEELARQLIQFEKTPDLNVKAGLEDLRDEILRVKKQLADMQGEDPMVPICVDSRVVASVISGWTGIPVGKMLAGELQTVLHLEQKMEERIIGQTPAVAAICRRIRTSRASLEDPGKPVGVFLLAGPSGVGKTETAIALADTLYGGEHNMIKVNMSEYQEAYTISNLKGSPPGYVGYGQGGVLTEAVRRNPYSVILLDEAEKAHTDVTELFYQVFDKGIMEDSEGLTVNFKNTVILLTSNLGTDAIMDACAHSITRPDAATLTEIVRPHLLKHFKPAFLGRMVIVPYYPLRDVEMQAITRLKLAKIAQRFQENHRAALQYGDDLVAAIAGRCAGVDSGARSVDHILTQTLLPELAEKVLEHMAQAKNFSAAAISLDPRGDFVYELKN